MPLNSVLCQPLSEIRDQIEVMKQRHGLVGTERNKDGKPVVRKGVPVSDIDGMPYDTWIKGDTERDRFRSENGKKCWQPSKRERDRNLADAIQNGRPSKRQKAISSPKSATTPSSAKPPQRERMSRGPLAGTGKRGGRTSAGTLIGMGVSMGVGYAATALAQDPNAPNWAQFIDGALEQQAQDEQLIQDELYEASQDDRLSWWQRTMAAIGGAMANDGY